MCRFRNQGTFIFLLEKLISLSVVMRIDTHLFSSTESSMKTKSPYKYDYYNFEAIVNFNYVHSVIIVIKKQVQSSVI
jgi:hypothetical protein